MNQKTNRRPGVTDLILVVLGAVYLVGLLTFLQPCGPKEDGSWMLCHWAGQSLRGLAALLLALAVLRLFLASGEIKRGLDVATIGLSLLAALTPGRLIPICSGAMMHMMRCHTAMTPGVMVLSALTALTAAVDLVLQRKKQA